MAVASCIAVETPPSTTSAAPTSAATTAATSAATTTTSASSTFPTPSLTTSTTRLTETALPPIPPCLTPEPDFGSEGEISNYDPTGSDSALLATIDWHSWEECERFLFSLASTEGAPTLVPPSAVLVSFSEEGVMRLSLGPEVGTSAISFQLVNTRLVDRVYVVKASGGGLLVDLHLAEPASARMIPSSGPATLTVDLRPEGLPFSNQPTITSKAVLFLPEGEEFYYPFTVSGYLSPGTEESVATLSGVGGISTEAEFPLAGADDLWSTFVAVFLEGPTGWATLRVEDAEARLFFGA